MQLLSDIKTVVRRGWRYVSDEVWDVELTAVSGLQAFGVKTLRVVNLVIRGYREDNCPLHASALTFNTLMAIVPVLALALALARVFGAGDIAHEKARGMVGEWTQRFESAAAELAPAEPGTVESDVPVQPLLPDADKEPAPLMLREQINDLVDLTFEKVENISFAALGGVGLVMLLWMVISVLGRVEASFNRVWGITTERSLWRKMTDYLFVVLVLPFLVTAASSIPLVDMVTNLLNASTAEDVRSIMGSAFLKRLMVLLLSSLSFMFMLIFMPNTRVRWRPAFIGGFVSAVLFIMWLWICAALQVGVARYGAIYGSFAVVPILLAWVHVSWQIVLLGAEVAFAVQNCTTYRLEAGGRHASPRARLALALLLLGDVATAMRRGAHGVDPNEFTKTHRVPVRLFNDVVDELISSGILGRLSDDTGHIVLLREPERLRIGEVGQAILTNGISESAVGLGVLPDKIQRYIDDLAVSGAHADGNLAGLVAEG